ncbi:MAG: type B 50S ribosomal protein L31 [Chlamydiae bacterium]|jgi:large subunit ribosomal protein L31|nr:type B 50S ribosomal protein L31 [Chlamydiota bacterium]
MKKEIHPEYKEVVFLDTGTGDKFLCRSAVQAKDTIEFEGATYPCFKVSITSKSHPFYTGEQGIVDTEGRVDKFKKRYAKPAQAAVKAEAAEVTSDSLEEKKKKASSEKAKKSTAKAKKSSE